MRTGIVLAQPHLNTLSVEPVQAGQLGHLVAHPHGFHADGTLCLAFGAQHALRDLDLGQRVDGTLRRRRRAIARIVLDQVRDDPVERFL